MNESSSSNGRAPHAGPIALFFLLAAAAGGVGWWTLQGRTESKAAKNIESAVTTPVLVGRFLREVVESGEVESSSNVEIRCEVDTGSVGLAILEIVPEGTYVNVGDFLVRLDDADLQSRLVTRQIDLNSSRASLAQARADLESARLTLQEYKEGTFREQEEEMESQEFVARENLRRAEEYFRYSERLSEKGYVSGVQLEADRFAVDKAQKELDVAETRIEVLRKYTREKMITQLEANIETGLARLSSAERAYEIDKEQLAEVETQIERCTIYAPTSGQVVYANKLQSADEPLIEEGRTVRERQEIIRLPDPRRMQVASEVNESRIDLLEEGMPVRITIDALPDLALTGELVKVTEYPLPRKSTYTAHIKNYGATIVIQDPPQSLRPGMTAQVAILVDERPEAIQVPVQAVVERQKRFFCVVNEGAGQIAAREVEIGGVNDQFVVVDFGLDGSENVMLSPNAYIDDMALPDASELAARKQEEQRLVARQKQLGGSPKFKDEPL